MNSAPILDLASLKADWRTFENVTGIGRPAQHHKSFLRNEHHGSLSVWLDDAGVIRWKDHGTGQGGTLIDAAALQWGCTTAEAIRRLAEMAGHSYRQNGHNGQNSRSNRLSVHSGRSVTPPAAREPDPPKPDRKRLRTFLAETRRHALESHPDALRYAERRGLDLALVAERYGVGFMPKASFGEWPTWTIHNSWALPITGPDGETIAVKLHREDPPGKPKCLWCPFGTEPKEKPRHGFATLWPDPDTEAMQERMAIRQYDGGLPRMEAERLTRTEAPLLFLCPGELKALAVLCAGHNATAITAGESHHWTPGLVARLNGRRVVVVFDDDDTGHGFRDRTIEALRGSAAELRAITFGRKEINHES